MKLSNNSVSTRLLIVLAGFVLASQSGKFFVREAFAQSYLVPSIPPEATAPLGELSAQNPALFDVSSQATDPRVDTASAGLSVKVAPGEILPISVKLSNFGGGSRVDVLMNYGIFSSAGDEIYSTSETVAVETTASFVKTIQIPFGTTPGTYTAKTSITYQGQLVPATTQFTFTIERKILGLFQSDFYLYGGMTLLLILAALLMSYLFVRHHGARFIEFDYSDIPHDRRTFYEILSDTIMQMRRRVGDDALVVASHVSGLKIDMETGKVLGLSGSPAKIIADLVSEYEKLLGKKVSFSFRKK